MPDYQTLTVTSAADSGAGSLRAAISQAGSLFLSELSQAAGDQVRIVFDESLSGEAIRLASALQITRGDISIFGDLDNDGIQDITVSGDTDGDGTGDVALVNVAGGAVARLDGLILTEAYSKGAGRGVGAAIRVDGDLTLVDSVISRTEAQGGNYSDLAQVDAATVFVSQTGALTVTGTVFENNIAVGGSGFYPGAGGRDGGAGVAGILALGDLTLGEVGFGGLGAGGIGEASYDGGAGVVGIYVKGAFAAPGGARLGVIAGSVVSSREPVGGDLGPRVTGALDPYSAVSGLQIGVSGTSGDDLIDRGGKIGGSFIRGWGGDDELHAAPEDVIFGGTGNDLIVFDGGVGAGGEGNPGATFLAGDEGSDIFRVSANDGAAAIQIFGAGGENDVDGARDLLSFRDSESAVDFDFAQDTNQEVNPALFLTFSRLQLDDVEGSDLADALAGDDIRSRSISGRAGDDVLRAGNQGDSLFGDNGADSLIGGAGDDELYGGGDDDVLFGGEGINALIGGGGTDAAVFDGDLADFQIVEFSGIFDVQRGLEFDRVSDVEIFRFDDVTLDASQMRLLANPPTAFDDDVAGTDHDDVIRGRKGDDFIQGGKGDDSLFGDAGHDSLFGQRGDDRLFGGGGRDRLEGHGGDDILRGGAGADNLNGGGGSDQVFGNGLSDDLRGGSGRDALFGGGGHDRLDGGVQADLLIGGGGRDVFALGRKAGADRILDWEDGRDRIDFASGRTDDMSELKIRQRGDDVLIIHRDGRLTVDHAEASDFDQGDFIF